MSQDATYRAVKTSFLMYGEFFRNVVREIGMERALVLHSQLGVPYGKKLAGMVQERAAASGLDIQALSAIQEANALEFGLPVETGAKGNVSQMTVRTCPIYDGLREAGLDHATVEALCQRLSAANSPLWKRPVRKSALRCASAPGRTRTAWKSGRW
jgi:hypothetical protein